MSSDIKCLAELISQAMKMPIWQDDGVFKLYLYCLSRASHNTYQWHETLVQPGDLPLSERHAAAALHWSRNKLDRKMKYLRETGLITIRSLAGRGTMLHMLHWPQNETTISSACFQNEASSRTQRREAARLVCKALAEGATIQAILDALETDKRSASWRQEEGRFIPGIVKWPGAVLSSHYTPRRMKISGRHGKLAEPAA